MIAETAPVKNPARLTGRILSGLVIVFLLFDGAIKLVPWPVVTETMDKMGYGSSETLARSLGLITIVLYAVPPTSILGAILLTGYSRRRDGLSRADRPAPCSAIPCSGFIFGLMVWGGLWLRDPALA